jgi:hypothetical protein
VKKYESFEEMLANDKSRQVYRYMIGRASEYTIDMREYAREVVGLCVKEAKKRQQAHDTTVIAIARRFLALLDGVSILLAGGNAEVCYPLLRSMLEAYLSVAHILQDKTRERANAYQLAWIKRRIKEYKRVSINTQEGKKLHAELAKDKLTPEILKHMPANLENLAAEMEEYLQNDDDFKVVLAEWERLTNPAGKKRNSDPHWYELFGGRSNIRDLALQLNHLGLYEFMYRDWSDSVHAGDALPSFTGSDGRINPLRHPRDYPKVVSHMFLVTINMLHLLADHYNPSSACSLRKYTANTLVPKCSEVADFINAVLAGMSEE